MVDYSNKGTGLTPETFRRAYEAMARRAGPDGEPLTLAPTIEIHRPPCSGAKANDPTLCDCGVLAQRLAAERAWEGR